MDFSLVNTDSASRLNIAVPEGQTGESPSYGYVSFDSQGAITGFDEGFQALTGGGMTDDSANTLTPPAGALLMATRHCDIRTAGGEQRPARIDYVRTDEGTRGEIRLEADDSPESLLDAHSSERTRLSRHLHDTVSQHLVVLALTLGKMQRAPGAGESEDLRRALDLVNRSCRDLRVVSYVLAPAGLESFAVAEGIELLAAYLRDDAGLDIAFVSEYGPGHPGDAAKRVLLPVVQEWATRAIRHSRGAKTFIRLAGAGNRVVLEFSCADRENEAVRQIFASPLIRARCRVAGGRLETIVEQDGVVSRLSLPNESPAS
ncbi:MAG TPA: histidine kinase [Bryobacteraceae bacterium]|nr:histidine kinase [Bryobacteraceae bacterium]